MMRERQLCDVGVGLGRPNRDAVYLDFAAGVMKHFSKKGCFALTYKLLLFRRDLLRTLLGE